MNNKLTKIEKQFFETFGINKSTLCKYAKYGYEGTEGIWYFCTKNQEECWTYPFVTGCEDKMTSYPQITDRILLELICILRNSYIASGETIDVLKERVLRACIRFQDDLVTTDKTVKQQVQELFKED